MLPALLMVDDDASIRTQLRWSLEAEYTLLFAENREEAVACAREHQPAVALLDLGLPPQSSGPDEGFAALAELLQVRPGLKVIIMSGQGEKGNALRAISCGAIDFLNKPVDVDELRVILKRTFYVAKLEEERRALEARSTLGGFEGMLGDSPQIQEMFAALRKVAAVDAPVLLLGESGTGKELSARAIHQLGVRVSGPFIAINCHAIPESLLESELFGHEKGAFTGAHTRRAGRIEMAAGGTLLLDEIGELTPSLQVKLLRFLQDQIFERVGGRTPLKVDTRIIAATHADLQKAMSDGQFREDLFFRIAVVTIRIPPLRERDGDIALIAQALLKKYSAEAGREGLHFSSKSLQAMQVYDWPGNVRELDNRIRRAVIMAESKLIKPSDLELETAVSTYGGIELKTAREQLEKDYVRHALARSHGNISKASELLGISRPTFYEMMEKLGIARPV